MSPTVPAALKRQKYLSLETYRKNGIGVRTPVWFAEADTAKLYVYTGASSGKAKRIRRNGAAKIAPCDAKGNLTGPWTDAAATIVEADEFNRGMQLLNQKYRPWKQILDLFFRLSPSAQRVVIAIRPI